MKSTITGELILLSAREMNCMQMDETRAAEIARELQRMNEAVATASAAGDFNEEPGRFASYALAQAQTAKRSR